MKSQTIQELEALTPVEMDAGLVFSGVPTGNKIWGYQMASTDHERTVSKMVFKMEKAGFVPPAFCVPKSF